MKIREQHESHSFNSHNENLSSNSVANTNNKLALEIFNSEQAQTLSTTPSFFKANKDNLSSSPPLTESSTTFDLKPTNNLDIKLEQGWNSFIVKNELESLVNLSRLFPIWFNKIKSESAIDYVELAIQHNAFEIAIFLLKSGFQSDRTTMKPARDNLGYQSPFFVTPLICLVKKIQQPNLSPNSYSSIHTLFTLLIDKQAKFEHQIGYASSAAEAGEIECSLIEYLYLNRSEDNTQLVYELTEILIEKGATLTPRMIYDMKLHVKAGLEKRFIPFLQKLGCLSEIEIASHPKEKFAHQLQEALTSINESIAKSTIRFLSLTHLAHFRQLRKRVKDFLKGQHDPAIGDLYNQFSLAYDDLVEHHPDLKTLQSLSREMRTLANVGEQDRNPSNLLSKFYSLFGCDQSYDYNQLKLRIRKTLIKSSRATYWDEMWLKFMQASATVQSNVDLSNSFIKWVHGTKSSSLPGIQAAKGILPMGKLLKLGIVPFAGERSGSSEKENASGISGEVLTFSDQDWTKSTNYLDGATRVLTSYLYAAKSQGYCQTEKDFVPQKAWERLTSSFLEKTIETHIKASANSCSNSWDVICTDISRLRLTDPQAIEKLKSYKETVLGCFVSAKTSCLQAKANLPLFEKWKGVLFNLNRILQCLDRPISYSLSEEDLIIIKNPYPIVFGSYTLKNPTLFFGEFLSNQDMLLGSDISVAFTLPQHMEHLQKKLHSFNVKVHPLDSLFYLEFANIFRGYSELNLNSNLKRFQSNQERNLEKLKKLQNSSPLITTPSAEPQYQEIGKQLREAGQGMTTLIHKHLSRLLQNEILPHLASQSIEVTLKATRKMIWSHLIDANQIKGLFYAGEFKQCDARIALAFLCASSTNSSLFDDYYNSIYKKTYAINHSTFEHYVSCIKEIESFASFEPEKFLIENSKNISSFKVSTKELYEIYSFIQLTEQKEFQHAFQPYANKSYEALLSLLYHLNLKGKFSSLYQLLKPAAISFKEVNVDPLLKLEEKRSQNLMAEACLLAKSLKSSIKTTSHYVKCIEYIRTSLHSLSPVELKKLYQNQVSLIESLQKDCQLHLNNIDFSGCDSLNRELLTSKWNKTLHQFDVILALFALEKAADKGVEEAIQAIYVTSLNKRVLNIPSMLYYGLTQHTIFALESLPVNKTFALADTGLNLHLDEYRRRKTDLSFMPILQAIEELSSYLGDTQKASEPSSNFEIYEVENWKHYKAFIKSILEQAKATRELTNVAGYSNESIKAQAHRGFQRLCQLTNIELSLVNLQEVIEKLALSSACLDQLVAHLLLDPLHLLAAMQDKEYILLKDQSYQLKDILTGLVEYLMENHGEDKSIAAEQIYLRLTLLAKKLNLNPQIDNCILVFNNL